MADFDGISGLFPKSLPWKIAASFKGSGWKNCRYEQLIPFEAIRPEKSAPITPDADPFRV